MGTRRAPMTFRSVNRAALRTDLALRWQEGHDSESDGLSLPRGTLARVRRNSLPPHGVPWTPRTVEPVVQPPSGAAPTGA